LRAAIATGRVMQRAHHRPGQMPPRASRTARCHHRAAGCGAV